MIGFQHKSESYSFAMLCRRLLPTTRKTSRSRLRSPSRRHFWGSQTVSKPNKPKLPKSPDTIITIDCEYTRPNYAAAYLIVEGGEAAFVDTNTNHSVPIMLNALKQQGLRPENVKYIIVTHAHLDHAGGKHKPKTLSHVRRRATRSTLS